MLLWWYTRRQRYYVCVCDARCAPLYGNWWRFVMRWKPRAVFDWTKRTVRFFFLFVALIYSFVFVLLIHFSHSMHSIECTHELGLNVIGKRKCECAYGVVQVNIMMDFLYLCCFVSEYSYSIQIGCMHGVRTHTKTRSITIDIMARNVEMVDNKNT